MLIIVPVSVAAVYQPLSSFPTLKGLYSILVRKSFLPISRFLSFLREKIFHLPGFDTVSPYVSWSPIIPFLQSDRWPPSFLVGARLGPCRMPWQSPSKFITSKDSPLSTAVVAASKNSSRLVAQDFTFMKPCWLLPIRLLASRCSVTSSLKRVSISLQHTDV
jgi:hypothetical protein